MQSTTNTTHIFEEAERYLKTVGDILRFAVSTFNQHNLCYGHGTTNAYDEAAYLILHTLHLPHDQLAPYISNVLLPHEIHKVLAILKKRVLKRIPAAYLTNEAICQGYSFYVNEDVIIPRSFLAEIIVNNGLQPWIEHPELVHNVLDLCTGNGSVAIIAADYFEDSCVIASDIDPKALAIAQKNIDNYQFQDRVQLIKSNLFTNLKKHKGQFDLILTNPPYVDSNRMGSLPAEYLHEPQIALDGGGDGLELIDKILHEAKHFLSEFGVLVVEMGDNQVQLQARYPTLPFTWLSTASGDGFVFVLTRNELNKKIPNITKL